MATSHNYDILEQVKMKLDCDFVGESMRTKMSEVHCNLQDSVHQYFKCYIITEALIKAIDSTGLPSKERGSLRLVLFLYKSLIMKYLPPDDLPARFRGLGLQQKYVSTVLEKENPMKSDLTELNKLIEDKINSFCAELINFCGTTKLYGNNWQKALHDEVSAKVSFLETEELTNNPKETKLTEIIDIYYKELTEGLSLLSELVQALKSRLKFESNLAKHYTQKCQTLYLRIRLMELEVRKNTYREETLAAHRLIRNQLEVKKKTLLDEVDTKTTTLQAYQVLGEDYEKLVENYCQLVESINKQRWAISVLQQEKEL